MCVWVREGVRTYEWANVAIYVHHPHHDHYRHFQPHHHREKKKVMNYINMSQSPSGGVITKQY